MTTISGRAEHIGVYRAFYRAKRGRAMRRILIALALAGLSAGTALGASYDGNWRVTIVTEKGDCDRAYGYSVAINNGKVRYVGDASINMSGSVSGSGTVKVSVSKGSQRADGSGKLGAGSGSGTWRGVAGSGGCAGTWTAEKR